MAVRIFHNTSSGFVQQVQLEVYCNAEHPRPIFIQDQSAGEALAYIPRDGLCHFDTASGRGGGCRLLDDWHRVKEHP